MFGCDGSQFFKNCNMGIAQAKKINNYLFYYKNMIGRGKFSQVYKGIDSRNMDNVAVKVISFKKYDKPHLMNLLYQQAEILPELDHPNVIKLYSRLISQNNCYLVMELCEPKNLDQRLRESGRLSTNQCERIIIDIFRGLCYLQEKGIVHRDLKTANILFGSSGKAKISDFGFAIRTYSEVSDIFAGTLFYMSPESMLFQKYSPKTDIWSFGVIIYELMHGYVPMKNCLTRQQVNSAIMQPVQIKSRLPSEVIQILQGCLELNPINRWDIEKIKNCDYIRKLNKKYHIETKMFKTPFVNAQQPIRITSTNVSKISDINLQTRSQVGSKGQQYSHYSFQSNYQDSFTSNQSNLTVKYSMNKSQFSSIVLNYQQIICLLHYCRLINRVLEMPNNFNQDLALWLLKIIYHLNSDTQFIGQSAKGSDSVLKNYRNKYHAKYGYLSKTGKNVGVDHVLIACTNMLRFSKVSNLDDQKKVQLMNYLLKQTNLLKECLKQKSFRKMQFSSQAERILR